MKTIQWVKEDGSEVRVEQVDEAPDYKRMCEFLQVGESECLEHVTILLNGRQASMFVHETGHMRGLPRNEYATQIYWAASRSRGHDPEQVGGHFIVGPAIICDGFQPGEL